MGLDGVAQHWEGRDGGSCVPCGSKFEKPSLLLTRKDSRGSVFSSL